MELKVKFNMIGRTIEHGARRSEEMQEAARMVEASYLGSEMSSATAERQAWAPRFVDVLGQPDLGSLLDAILMAHMAQGDAAVGDKR